MKKRNILLLVAGIAALVMVFGFDAFAGRYGMGMYGQGYGPGPGYSRGMGMYGPGPGYGRGMGMYGQYGPGPGRGVGWGNCPGWAGSELSN